MYGINRQKIIGKLWKPAMLFALLFGWQISAKAQNAATVEDLVKTISGGTLQAEIKAAPYQLTADFDGDKIKDVAVIVRLADSVEKISKNVKIEYPYFSKEVDAESFALMIIHGKGKGWQCEQKSSVLFLGLNSSLIFEPRRLGEKGDGGENWEIEKLKGGKVRLYFATEGAEGYLKWNGKKYVWTENQP